MMKVLMIFILAICWIDGDSKLVHAKAELAGWRGRYYDAKTELDSLRREYKHLREITDSLKHAK